MLFDTDIEDWFDLPLLWGETEEVRKKRKEYLEAKRNARRKAMEKLAIPSSTLTLPMDESEERFKSAVEQYAKAHKNEKVKAFSLNFPNGYYRSVVIENK